ncbi:MAG: NAD(P)-dependent oxidoreductase [Gammaproteobacteria bacterium]|nr:NAD(P)-dependent oxidoreductase [Gammaproteobacteria bacterium]
MSRNIVVTGGSGFIGTYLCKALSEQADVDRIVVLDRVPPSQSIAKLQFVQCDLRDPLPFMPDFPVATCFHLAAACREPGFDWDEYFVNNHVATRRVTEWAVRCGIPSIVFTSTAMVFRAGDERHRESDTPNADTAYGISKALAEETLRGWRDGALDRRLRVVRPGVVFGCGAGGNFVNLYKALRRGLFAYIGRRTTVKSAIYVKDLVRLLLTVERDAQQIDTFHGAYFEPTTIGSVCASLCKAYGWSRFIPVIPFRLAWLAAIPFQALDAIGLRNPVHTRRIEKLFCSTDLSAENLRSIGFEHQFSLDAAIADWRESCAPKSLY